MISEDENEPVKEATPEEPEFINFGLLMKGKGGGGKQALKSIKVAATSDLACLLRDREQEAQIEKERVKQLTLNISRRMQQEEEQAGKVRGHCGNETGLVARSNAPDSFMGSKRFCLQLCYRLSFHLEMADLQKKVRENLAPQPYTKVQQPQKNQGGGAGGGLQHQRGAPGPHEAFSKSWQRR